MKTIIRGFILVGMVIFLTSCKKQNMRGTRTDADILQAEENTPPEEEIKNGLIKEPDAHITDEQDSHEEDSIDEIAMEMSNNINERVNSNEYLVRNEIEGETAHQRREREISVLNAIEDAEANPGSISDEEFEKLCQLASEIPLDRLKMYYQQLRGGTGSYTISKETRRHIEELQEDNKGK